MNRASPGFFHQGQIPLSEEGEAEILSSAAESCPKGVIFFSFPLNKFLPLGQQTKGCAEYLIISKERLVRAFFYQGQKHTI